MILNMMGGGGSGGVELNFEVVGGTTQPTNPKENTIWVNTAVPITEWVFSTTEPVNPIEGMVWIKTGTSSSCEFNALNDNSIICYPQSALQYIGNVWTYMTAKSYRNQEWTDWTLYIFSATKGISNGEWYESTGSTGTFTIDENAITLKNSSNSGTQPCFAVNNTPIDCSKFTKITVVATLTNIMSAASSVGVHASTTGGSYSDYVASAKINNETITIALPTSGIYYFKANVFRNDSPTTTAKYVITEIRVE